MTTARERYEAKTRVVTFRVTEDLYSELKQTMADSGLSFADLVKLGADIAREEIVAKLAEMTDLQVKLEQLRKDMQSQKQLAAEGLEKEKQAQFEALNQKIEAFKLFDLGWGIEEVMSKTGKFRWDITKYFDEWAKMRGEKKKVQEELLKRCVRWHIAALEEHIRWWVRERDREEANMQMERCRHLLMDPSLMTDQERTFFLTEYSHNV